MMGVRIIRFIFVPLLLWSVGKAIYAIVACPSNQIVELHLQIEFTF